MVTDRSYVASGCSNSLDEGRYVVFGHQFHSNPMQIEPAHSAAYEQVPFCLLSQGTLECIYSEIFQPNMLFLMHIPVRIMLCAPPIDPIGRRARVAHSAPFLAFRHTAIVLVDYSVTGFGFLIAHRYSSVMGSTPSRHGKRIPHRSPSA